MIAKIFDLDEARFLLTLAAKIAGVNRAVFDMWLNRGYIGRSNKNGRPLFSAREIFKARLLHELSNKIALSDYRDISAEAASIVAETGEWMYATARHIKQGRPFAVYAYATRIEDKWKFDMHIGKRGEKPRFGWDAPHIYLPMSDIFAMVYTECNKIIEQETR